MQSLLKKLKGLDFCTSFLCRNVCRPIKTHRERTPINKMMEAGNSKLV